MKITRSKRPGRRNAMSTDHGRFVAPRINTPSFRLLAPSISLRNWLTRLDAIVIVALDRFPPSASSSSKNSTLGAVVSYYELALVTSISVGNGAPAVPSYLLTLTIFIVLSLVLSGLVNLGNRRLALVER